MKRGTSVIFVIISLSLLDRIVSAGEAELQSLIARLNSDVLELRNEVESSISTRCESISDCAKSSHDECHSAHTELQTCPGKDEFGIVFAACGAGLKCNGLIDFSVSTVRIPENLSRGPNGNPTNPKVIEDVCMTLPVERWMVNKYASDKAFWSSLNAPPPQMYFGSDTGVFRIYPARQSQECGQYDPRSRPWYQAALPSTISNAVKPRRVVIILDTSRSMEEPLNAGSNQTKLSFVKLSVVAILNTLSPNDSIAVISFDETARLVDQPSMFTPVFWEKARKDTVENIINRVNELEVNGRSNWEVGFGFAFDLIQDSLKSIAANGTNGDESYCDLENIAVFFFSDGEFNLPAGATDEALTNFVSTKVIETELLGDYHVHMFLYSLGFRDPSGVEKKISCAVDGYWKPLTQGVSPVNVTNGYQTLFSTSMGTDAFYNYTTWSEPYIFTSGRPGYTVSALVYDRDLEPPQFKGAVGMDITVAAAQQVFGGTENETKVAIKKIIQNITSQSFTTTCDQQRLNLTPCEIQSIRHYSGGDDAVCIPQKNSQTTSTNTSATFPLFNVTTNSTEDVENEVIFLDLLNCSKTFKLSCPGYNEYPTELWRNVEMSGLTYQERVCCEVGTNETSENCPELDEDSSTRISNPAIFGILFASLVVVELLGCYFCFYFRGSKQSANSFDV